MASSMVTEDAMVRPDAMVCMASAVVTEVTMVRPEAMLEHSSIKAMASLVRRQVVFQT